MGLKKILLFGCLFLLLLKSVCISANNNSEGEKKHPADIYLKAGEKCYDKKQYSKTIENCSKVIELTPDSEKAYRAYFFRGLAYAALQQYDKAIQSYTKALKLKKQEAIFYSRGEAYAVLQQHEKAIQDYSEFLKLNKHVAGFYRRGKEHIALQQYNKAIKDYSKAIELAPEEVELYLERAWAYICLEQYDEAWHDYSKAKKLDPDCGELHHLVDYSRLKEYSQKIKNYSEIIKSKPNSVEAYLDRGSLYNNLKQNNKAIQDYSMAIKLNTDNPIAYRMRGMVYAELKQYNKAIQDYSMAIKYKPDFCDDYIGRGNAYYELDQYEKAIQDYSKALKLEPEPGVDNYIYYRRGYSYYKTKQYDKVIKDFSMLPGAGGCFERANIYCELKQYDKAIKEYSKAIELKQSTQIWEYSQAAYLCIMEICILNSKPKQFEYWLEQFKKNIPEKELSKGNVIIKLFLILVHRRVMNESTADIEKRFDILLKDNIELDWSFELTDEWLNSSKNGLTSEQVKYIQDLTKRIKT